jgi:hypothetical protein
MKRYTQYGFTQLLTQNAKLSKANPLGIDVWGLALSPYDSGGFQVCAHATAGCVKACLIGNSGRTVGRAYQLASRARTQLYFAERPTFIRILRESLSRLPSGSAVRLNIGSDIPWERVQPWIFTEFPDLRYYDYTKWPINKRRELPSNYSLTYSVHETTPPELLQETLDSGRNATIVFSSRYNAAHSQYGTLPELVRLGGAYYRVVDGDEHDLRLPSVDGSGVIVGLRAKGRHRQAGIDSGFIRWFASSVVYETLQRKGVYEFT